MKLRRRMYYQPSDPLRDPVDWEFDGNTLAIRSEGNAPAELGKCCREWYGFRDRIREISVGEGITRIGPEYFMGCLLLEKVYLPETLKEVGRMAFFGCENLRMVRLPAACRCIRDAAFANCTRLGEVSLSPELTEIEEQTFRDCRALGDIELPPKLNRIGSEAFLGTGVMRPLGENMALMSHGTLYYLTGEARKVLFLPPEIRRVAGGALAGVRAGCIVIPDTVEALEPYAFKRIRAEAVFLGTGIRSLPPDVFSGCGSLRRLYIAGTLEQAAENIRPSVMSLDVITVRRNKEILKRAMGEERRAVDLPFSMWDFEEDSDDERLLNYRMTENVSEVLREFYRGEEDLLRGVYRAPAYALDLRPV